MRTLNIKHTIEAGIFILALILCCPTIKAQQISTPQEHSANKAVLLSILPGGGQIYNHQAWKLPIIYGALGTMGYLVYDNYSSMMKFKTEYLYRVEHNDTPNLADYANYPNSSIYNMYQTYNQYFQLMVIISVGVYALNLVDAYVFGHLFDFQINDDLSLNLHPSMTLNPSLKTATPTFGLTLNF